MNMGRGLMGNQPTVSQFITTAQTWPSRDNPDWSKWVEEWKYGNVRKMLSKDRKSIETAIETLNPTLHSLPLSYILGWKATQDYDDPKNIILLLNQISSFMRAADGSQLCIQPRPMTDALKFYVGYMKRENAMGLIPDLKNGIALLQGRDSNNHVLTFAHCELMEICVSTKCFNMAFPEIEQEIFAVQGNGSIESFDNLRYHYYGACIYMALKQFDKALEFLTMVITAPSEAISVVQIAAYKKWVLANLIHKRHLTNLPRYTPNTLRRYFNKLCSQYSELSQAFSAGGGSGVQIVQTLIAKNLETYQKDGNFGLVQQVIGSLEKNAVTKLTSVYTRLSMPKVADLCGLQNSVHAKKVVISMIQKGELAASIDYEGVVTFEQDISKSDSEMLKTIHSRIDKSVQLWNTLDAAQMDIKKNKDFIKKNLDLPGSNDDENVAQAMLQQMLFQ